MAIEAKKVDFSKINEVKSGDSITPEHINAPLRASAWVQSLATNQPIVENNDNGGTPNVTIEEVNGTPRFKFENISGKDFSQDVEQLQEVSIRNTNKVVAIENALIKVGTLAKQDGTLTEATQQTGGTGLLDFTIVDNSYATVKKIQGNTVLSGNELVNAKFKGITSTNKNWFNPNLLLVPNGWTENNGVYSGHVATIHGVYKDTMGGLLKINTSGQVTVSFVGKNETLNQTTFGIGFTYTDGTDTSDTSRVWIRSNQFEKYSITSVAGKTVDLIYVSFANGDMIYLKDFCVKLGTDDTYIPYEESSLMLDNAVELGKWDYIENGKIVKHTEIETFTSPNGWTVGTSDYGILFATTPTKGKVDRASVLVNNIFPNRWPDQGLPCLYSPKDTIVVFPNADKNNPTITTIEQWGNYLKELNDNGTPLTVAYPVKTPTETDISANFEYLVWDKGQEIMQLENEAVPQVTNEYFVVLGGKE